MPGSESHNIPWIVLSRISGMILFVVIVLILNICAGTFTHPAILLFVAFINENFWLVILFSIFFLIGEIFEVLVFPLCIPAPLFSAMGSVLLVSFILRIFSLINEITGTRIFGLFENLSIVILPLIFLLVLCVGYFKMFKQACGASQPEDTLYGTASEGESGDDNDIGLEIRRTICAFLRRIRSECESKKP